MKKKFSLLLAGMLLGGILVVPAHAEDDQPAESSVPTSATEPSTPTQTTAPSDPSTPVESKPTDPTQGSTPTEPSDPKPCTHVFGDWTADEAAHGHFFRR